MQIYDKEYRIAQLLAKEITGTLSLEEREELEIWRNENHSTQELYKQILDMPVGPSNSVCHAS